MLHTNYHEIKTSNNYQMGWQLGKLFGKNIFNDLKRNRRPKHRIDKTKQMESLKLTKNTFPHLYQEIQGFSEAANISLNELWYFIADDLDEKERCTTVITNNGYLFAHNEDLDEYSANSICVLKKSIKNFTILELYYMDVLGGNAFSINSYGFVQSINTLPHKFKQSGIPRNIIARWMSETKSPDSDFIKLKNINRASGYNHNIAHFSGKVWNIECSAAKQIMTKPPFPFCHTNHFLTNLAWKERTISRDSQLRLNFARANTKKQMTFKNLNKIMSDDKQGPKNSLFNRNTIARVILDLNTKVLLIWLKREQEKNWIKYDLDFC